CDSVHIAAKPHCAFDCLYSLGAYDFAFDIYAASLRERPSSTLFPYTTLFRSDLERGNRIVRHAELARDRKRVARDAVAVRGRFGDRKSTRLNSSHLGISYAVFCLKKKRTKSKDHASALQIPYKT